MNEIEFIGGSKDGAVFGIPPQMNTTIRFPIPEWCEVGQQPVGASEIYRYNPLDHRYHFTGYDL